MSTTRFLLPLTLLVACVGGTPNDTNTSASSSDTDTDTDTDTSTDGTSTTLTTGVTTTNATGTATMGSGDPSTDPTTTTMTSSESTSTTGVVDPCDPDPCDHPEPVCEGNVQMTIAVTCVANGEDYDCVEEGGMVDCGEQDPVQACLDGQCSAPPTPVEGEVVLVEIMPDPAGVEDNVGEWIEVKNMGPLPVDLDGCHLADGNNEDHTIDGGGPVVIKSGELAVIAASADAMMNGGIDGVLYGYGDGFSLGNISDTVILRCDDVDIDMVSYEADGWPYGVGKSMGLDPGMEDWMLNDLAAAWCEAKDQYGNADLGTPGQVNPACG